MPRISAWSDTETDEQDEDEKGGGRRRVFFPVSVFDITQTEPMEGVEDVTDLTPPIEREADGYTTPAKDGQPIRVVIDSTGSPAAQAATTRPSGAAPPPAASAAIAST